MVWWRWRHRLTFRGPPVGTLGSGFLGRGVFVSYPVAPPRLFDLCLVDTVTESSEAYRYLQPPAFVNQYAAMPSLHAGWDLLVGLAIVGAAGTIGLRMLGVLMPVLMMWAVVATANHYVLDVVAGVALALIGHAAALHLERQRSKNRAAVGADLG
jgi:membrane-associated phospholipid phosphatase